MTPDYYIKTPNDKWLKADPCVAAAAFIAMWHVQLGIFGDLEIDLMNYDPETSPESPKVGGDCCAPPQRN